MVSEQWELCQSVDHSRCPRFTFLTEWRGLQKGKFSEQWTFVFLTQISAWKDVTLNWKPRLFAFTFFRKVMKQMDGNIARFFLSFNPFFFSKIENRWIVSSCSSFRTNTVYIGKVLLGPCLSILIFLQIWGWIILVIIFIF